MNLKKFDFTPKSPNACFVAYPIAWGTVPQNYLNFIRIFKGSCDSLYAITSNKLEPLFLDEGVKVISTRTTLLERGKRRPLNTLLKICLIQIEISFAILKLPSDIKILFFIGSEFILLPLIVAKLLGKKTILHAGGSPSKSFFANHPNNLMLFFIYKYIEYLNYLMVNQIAVESESVINFLKLDKLSRKAIVYGGKYIDTSNFYIKRNINHRDNLVGYIGSLSLGKGIENFMKSIPRVLESSENVRFLIAGDGPLYDKLNCFIEENDLGNNVVLHGWLSHDDILPIFLNELKILVLPSYSEGLPGIVQEAMACGAVVLATHVGGIPDLIKEEQTGFILRTNSPEEIALKIISVLRFKDLEGITLSAHDLINAEHTYNAAIQRCKENLLRLYD